MHGKVDDLPLIEDEGGLVLRGAEWGGMSVNINRFPPGWDLSPLLERLPGGGCTCPHFGYMIEGSWIIDYTDGTSETIDAGESFYIPATHNGARSPEGALVAEFSPVDQLAPVMADLAKLVDEMG